MKKDKWNDNKPGYRYPEEPAKYVPGDYVVLKGFYPVHHKDGRVTTRMHPVKEYGRVIYSWWNFKYGWRDYYVAFFGFKPPRKNQRLAEKPYVLHYLETSLYPYLAPLPKNPKKVTKEMIAEARRYLELTDPFYSPDEQDGEVMSHLKEFLK